MSKTKPYINMTTKGLSHKQIIISMSTDNISKFMLFLGKHVTNINRSLKNIKSDIIIDFICNDHHGFIITSNKVTSQSNISAIENYIKNINFMKANNIISSCLLQSKSYLKILDISYIIKRTNTLINSSIAKSIIKSTYIFENVYITFKLQVIKVHLKLDITIV